MIAFVQGKVFAVEVDGRLIIDKMGVGLEVLVPLAQFEVPPQIGEEIFLHTYLQVREDAWTLFGFPQPEQLEIFHNLLGVSGVGAKTALSVINSLSVNSIIAAVHQEDATRFTCVRGLGKKISQRLVLELKDKFAKWESVKEGAEAAVLPQQVNQETSDLLFALSQLGYNTQESRQLAAKAVKKLGKEASATDLIKEALRLAAKA
ncbi:MAG: Holliday junction branch migration protein RuvA [Bacillota bacterium]|jgi:Holliday junction DNA helicase RuvA